MSTALPTYLDQATLPFPFCPGCGHGTILERLDAALVKLEVDPRKVVIVSDIGCSGLSDRFFATNAVHGLHGRSVTYATGIKLADPELHVVVLMGDGGCGIGGHHLINAARRNIGVTVIVFNNLNYGMTGGEHSVSTPPGGVTATTPLGQIERPMDICGTVAVNGASFVARTSTFHGDVTDLMERALRNDGFSLVDVWELCTAYYAPANKLSRKSMEELLDTLGLPAGVLAEAPRPEYAKAYRVQYEGVVGREVMPPRPMEPRFESGVDRPLSWVIAGAAGKRIGSAAGALARGGVLSGLWATQRNDYPVTVRTGFSLSEVILSPEEVLFTATPSPDVVLDLFPEGHAKVAARVGALGPGSVVYRNAELPVVETRARTVTLDFAGASGWERRKDSWALMAVAAALRDSGSYPVDALREAAGAGGAAAVEAGLLLG
ncbi:MAG: thiamine pyrophosphate-dependent enzyme [Gemmatimonadota bacterium]|nr:thiamine pyrophosphate-dependent enzyme [Gemmatimonadota bacterium]